MQWFSQAPANIALIKYMGQKDEIHRIPINPSLSYTLNHLLSYVMLEATFGKHDFWEPLEIPGSTSFSLTVEEQTRFLKHLSYLKNYFNYSGVFIVRSSNNFPLSSGLASSASSFAALTKCAVLALSELTQQPLLPIAEQAKLSRLGSGSSCRSFFSPWALWDEDDVNYIEINYPVLLHQVIIISHNKKMVPSAEAHKRIKTSPHYALRGQRARENLQLLLAAFAAKNWQAAYQICWREFQDMHRLFTSCQNPFSYITEKTQQALDMLTNLWQERADGPIITMDAGPNIHLLYRADQSALAHEFKQEYLIGNYDTL